MKGIKRKVVDTKEEVKEKIKNETSKASEFSEEDDDKNITFAEILQDDVFENTQGDSNEKRQERHDVREDGRKQRGHDEGQKNHDQESKSSREEKTSSEKESKESSSKEAQEKIIFKHGIPKEISVSIMAKVTTLPYENIDISTGITLTLPPDATHTTAILARSEAYAYCENFIAEKVTEIRKSVSGAKK